MMGTFARLGAALLLGAAGCASPPPPASPSSGAPTGFVGAPAASGASSATACADAAAADGLEQLTSEELATKLFVLIGGPNLANQILDQMVENLRKLPGLPPEFFERLRREAHAQDFTKLVVPIYIKHYDRDTMIAAIRFDQSKPGAAIIAELPAVTREAGEVGREWGRKLGQQVVREMKEGGEANPR